MKFKFFPDRKKAKWCEPVSRYMPQYFFSVRHLLDNLRAALLHKGE